MLRLAYLIPSEVTQVGPMCASPDGSGFEISFQEFRIAPL
jgi:regulation of enolase protein 1 (concanavalin A-like superfamily)